MLFLFTGTTNRRYVIFGLKNRCSFECFEPQILIIKISYSVKLPFYESVSNSSINQQLHASSREAVVDIRTVSGCKFTVQ